MSVTLYLRHGDCVQVLGEHPDESVGAVVCDPPYELSFMGKGWDGTGVAYDPVLWNHLYRVLVPGGVVKAFSATRTFHRMGAAMQRAGFTALGMEAWAYGSGFPKSLNIGKAIDRIDSIGPMGERARKFTAWMRSTGITAKQIGEALSSRFDPATAASIANHYTTHPTQPRVATEDLFNLLRPLLPTVPDEIEELVCSRTVEVENMKRRKVVGEQKGTHSIIGSGLGGTAVGIPQMQVLIPITAPATDDARTWDGWGTALKPSWEPVLVGRKPL